MLIEYSHLDDLFGFKGLKGLILSNLPQFWYHFWISLVNTSFCFVWFYTIKWFYDHLEVEEKFEMGLAFSLKMSLFNTKIFTKITRAFR